jgi:hypothetical protein
MDYQGWQVEIQTKKAPDANGWRVYVLLATAVAGAMRTVPLSFKDGRAFATEAGAIEAGAQLREGLDRQAGITPRARRIMKCRSAK